MTKVRRCNIGRYFSGDIEGKFWFCVQPSDAADRFGVLGREPDYITYYFDKDDLVEVDAELNRIFAEHHKMFKKIQTFFEGKHGYNNSELDAAGITKDDLREYADWQLGKEIAECIEEHGQCSFEAEL